MAKRDKQFESASAREVQDMMGGRLRFEAAEAYKLLRTNLSFCLANSGGCKVIGVTSALRGEGKTTTAINLAYTMAQTGKKVLLMEADLRLPAMARRLKLHAKPGLSNMLVGQCCGADILQVPALMENLTVITAGDVPPNPAELLDSEQMSRVVAALSGSFDVIVMDLPPVSAVSDALIVSGLVSGMVVVVRQNYCDKAALNEAVRQLQFVQVKILGFVMTNASTREKDRKQYGYDKTGRK